MKPPPAKRAKHTNTTANDEKKAVKHHTPGRPACPKSAAAFKKTCQWLRCSDRPKSLQEVVGHMAQQVGEASSWSSVYLRKKLEDYFGDGIEIKLEGRDNIIHFKYAENEESMPSKPNIQKVGDESVSEISLFSKVSELIRKELLDKTHKFTGCLNSNSEKESVSNSLMILLRMIIDGPSFLSRDKSEDSFSSEPIILSIAQLIAFNTVEKRSFTGKYIRHSKHKCTPFPLYVGIKSYLKTKGSMVKPLSRRGISPCYDFIRSFTKDVANSVIKFWEDVGLVVPPQAKKEKFVIIGFDNIDWNAKSALSRDESTLHGTIITVHQFDSSDDIESGGQNVDILHPDAIGLAQVKMLPHNYADIDQNFVITDDDQLFIPKSSTTVTSFKGSMEQFLSEERCWMKESIKMIRKPDLNSEDWVSWASFFASRQTKMFASRMLSHVMPILLQKASDPSTVAHVLKIACGLTQYLNPGQIAMVETDQPLYQIAKKLQWKYPDEVFSEDNLFVSLGSLHTEKMLWQMSGDIQECSGIVTAFQNSGIETFGSNTFLICNSITTTRYHKQILVLALEILKNRAYEKYKETYYNDKDSDLLFEAPLSLNAWNDKMRADQPQADYFSLCQEIDLAVLEVVRCCRVADFDGFVDSISVVCSFVGITDHLHYLRNLPVFLRDLRSLKERHPSLYNELKVNGNFMGRKTNNFFSSIPIDQATEHTVCWLKNESGVIGNLDDPQTVRRHQAAIPELARIVQEFESGGNDENDSHHEMYPKFQQTFRKDVLALVDSFEKLGNPWLETSGLLYDLNESIVMPEEVVENVRQFKSMGKGKFEEYLQSRINSQTNAFTDTIKKSSLMLFKKALESKKPTKTVKSVVAERKQQQARVLEIVSAHEAGRTITALSRESSIYPPSLTKDGTMHHGSKADLVDLIVCNEQRVTSYPDVTCVIIDGAALVRKIIPRQSSTIGEYIETELKESIIWRFKYATRVDLVFDQYKPGSIKTETRIDRGSSTGKRRKVSKNAKIPGKWSDFLSCSENKSELFPLISECLVDILNLPPGQTFVASVNDHSISTDNELDLSVISPCSHEEADTRMFLHMLSGNLMGHKKILIEANDTDVIVIGARAFALRIDSIEELWIAFSTGKKLCYVGIHDVVQKLGTSRAMSLPGFHALTGCDTTSTFFGKGKKTTYSTWQKNQMFDNLFLEMSSQIIEETDLQRLFPLVQHFVCATYGVEQETRVDDARHLLLLHHGRDFDNMPPSSDALYQHFLRSCLQSGNIWGNIFQGVFEEKIIGWGWDTVGSIPTPIYTTREIISKNMRELSRCSCKGRCTKNCGCKKDPVMPCTRLCGCQGKCAGK